jgi:hypothetical protein
MATLAQKIECEERMRNLLRENGLPEPDGVEYGFTCVRFFFEDQATCVVVDIDNPDDEATLEDVAEAELEASEKEVGYLQTFGDPLSDQRHN